MSEPPLSPSRLTKLTFRSPTRTESQSPSRVSRRSRSKSPQKNDPDLCREEDEKLEELSKTKAELTAKERSETEELSKIQCRIDIKSVDLEMIALDMKKLVKWHKAGESGKRDHGAALKASLIRHRDTADARHALLKRETQMKNNLDPTFVEGSSVVKMYISIIKGFVEGNTHLVPKTRDKKQQGNFRESLITAYKSQHSDPEQAELYWCPVLHDWFLSVEMKAAHIIPSSLPPAIIDDICGYMTSPFQHTPKNGLFINSLVEEAFDKGNILIKYVDGSPLDCPEFEVRAVKMKAQVGPRRGPVPDRKNANNYLEASEIDHRRLKFRSDFRPSRKLMWWKYTMARIDLKVSTEPEHLALDEELAKQPAWPTVGPYIARSSLLEDMCNHVNGFFDPEDWADITRRAKDVNEPHDQPLWGHTLDKRTRIVLAGEIARDMFPGFRQRGINSEIEEGEPVFVPDE